jgi:hypothetical protein
MMHDRQTEVLQPPGTPKQIAVDTGIGGGIGGALDFDIECLQDDPMLECFEASSHGPKGPLGSRFNLQAQALAEGSFKEAVIRARVNLRGETYEPAVGVQFDRYRDSGLADVVGIGMRMPEDQMLSQGLPSPDFWQSIIRLQVDEQGVRNTCAIHLGKNLFGIGSMRDQAVAIDGDPLAGIVVAVFLNPLHFGLPGVVTLDPADRRHPRLGWH